MFPPVTEPLVSVQWLKKNLQNPDLIILDASLKENKAKLKAEYEGFQLRIRRNRLHLISCG